MIVSIQILCHSNPQDSLNDNVMTDNIMSDSHPGEI